MAQTLPPPIVITAPALPTPAAERVFLVEELSAGELRNAPSTQLDEILKAVPGVQTFRRSDARSAHPTSQGVTLRALGGNASSRALLVLDGVPQADPFGGWVNWPAYDPGSLSSVRVIRGGGSVAHGAGALAGTIEMRSAAAGPSVATLDVGSRQAVEGRFHTSVAGGLSLTARAARGGGFVPVTASTRGSADRPAPYAQASARLQLAMPLGTGIDMQLAVAGFRDVRARGLAFTANRTTGADISARLVGTGPLPWSVLAYGQSRRLESSFASVDPGRTTATRVSLQDAVPSTGFGGSLEVRPRLGPAELRIGADVRGTSGESRELFSYVVGLPTRRRIAGGETLTGGAFAELTLTHTPLMLSGGVRLDRWRIEDGRLLERQLATGALLRDERYATRSGWLPTARIGAVYDLGKVLSLRSAAYLGWRLPTLNELFRPFRAGPDATAANPLLSPERLSGLEAGVRYSDQVVLVEISAFANRLRDAIANVTLGQGPGVFPGVGFVGSGGEYRQRRNLDAIRVRGIELSAEAHRGPWNARLGYSFADATVYQDGTGAPLDGLRPAQTPQHMATAALTWADAGRSFSAQLRRAGPQFEDDLNQRRLPAATTLDVFAALPIGRCLALVARGENILNNRVVVAVAANGTVERATPQTFWIGARLGRSRE